METVRSICYKIFIIILPAVQQVEPCMVLLLNSLLKRRFLRAPTQPFLDFAFLPLWLAGSLFYIGSDHIAWGYYCCFSPMEKVKLHNKFVKFQCNNAGEHCDSSCCSRWVCLRIWCNSEAPIPQEKFLFHWIVLLAPFQWPLLSVSLLWQAYHTAHWRGRQGEAHAWIRAWWKERVQMK